MRFDSRMATTRWEHGNPLSTMRAAASSVRTGRLRQAEPPPHRPPRLLYGGHSQIGLPCDGCHFTGGLDRHTSGATDLAGPNVSPVPRLLTHPVVTYHRGQDISGDSRILLDAPGAVAIPVPAVRHIDAHIEALRKQRVTRRFAHAQQHLEFEP